MKVGYLLFLSILAPSCGQVDKFKERVKNKPASQSEPTLTATPTQNQKAELSEAELNARCQPELQAACADLSAAVKKLREERDLAYTQNEQQKTRDLQWQINEKMDLLAAYRQGYDANHSEVQKVHKMYEKLAQIAEHHEHAGKTLPPYLEVEKEAVREVFQDTGELYVGLSAVNAEGKVTANTASIKGDLPWAGYWYPKRSREIFSAPEASLKKFDRLLEQLGMAGQTAAWEDKHYNENYSDWEGLCDAWALAATVTREPKQAVEWQGVEFQVADLKALATKLFEGTKPKIYGRRYMGDESTDGQIQDLRPEAFHRLVTYYIGEKNRPLILDDDPGVELWAKPLVSMNWKVTQDPENPEAFLVKAWPKMVNNRSTISNDLTTVADLKSPEYSYRLYLDKEQKNANGEFKVIYGEWVGRASLGRHPDIVFLPHTKAQPTNAEIAKNMQPLKELLNKAGMLAAPGSDDRLLGLSE